jgi:hypothetical protein
LIVYKKLHVFLVYPDPLRSAINEEVRDGAVREGAHGVGASPRTRVDALAQSTDGVEE